MLFRRIAQHIKDQNWVAIGIDFAIVVVGVFIGIQVANWNDARVAAANEAELMVRLTSEMLALESELAEDAEGYKSTVEATGKLLTALRADALPQLEFLINVAGLPNDPAPNSGRARVRSWRICIPTRTSDATIAAMPTSSAISFQALSFLCV